MKNGILKTGLFLMTIFSMTLFISCGDDEPTDITGCMDSAAENYNADANVAGDCVYAADKFIGTYLGSSDCMGGLAGIVDMLTNDMLSFSVSSSVAGGPNDVLINIPIQGTPVAFSATVEDNNLTVDANLSGLPFPDGSGGTIMVIVQADGVMVYDDTDDSATGTINVAIFLDNSAMTSLDAGSCAITGVKQ